LLTFSNPSTSHSNELNDYYLILADDLQKMGQSIKSESDNIWESLNHLCHNKFGFGDDIKQSANLKDLQWAEKILPLYKNWEKMILYHSMIDLWIEKVNRFMMKINVERHVILSPHSSESPLSFNFKSSKIYKEKEKYNDNEMINKLSEGM
jgi:hypothetical protein